MKTKNTTNRIALLSLCSALIAGTATSLSAAPSDAPAHPSNDPMLTDRNTRTERDSMRSDRDSMQMHDKSKMKHGNELDFAAVQDDGRRTDEVSSLIGATLVDSQGEEFGSVTNLVREDDRIVAAHVRVGATLGLGGETYRVPFSALQISQDEEGDTQVQLTQNAIDQLTPQTQELDGYVASSGQGGNDRSWNRSSDQRTDRPNANREWNSNTNTGAAVTATAQNLTGEAKQFMDDLKSELKDNDAVSETDLTRLNVEVKDKTVTLRGTVASERIRREIVDAAEEIGDYRVRNEIEVSDRIARR